MRKAQDGVFVLIFYYIRVPSGNSKAAGMNRHPSTSAIAASSASLKVPLFNFKLKFAAVIPIFSATLR